MLISTEYLGTHKDFEDIAELYDYLTDNDLHSVNSDTVDTLTAVKEAINSQAPSIVLPVGDDDLTININYQY